MVKPTLVVLAAGMGSRYGGLKQMDPVGPGGETLLDYNLHDAARAGFGRAVFVVRRAFVDAFREGPGARAARRLEVDYAFQSLEDLPPGFSPPEGRSKPWGTGQAVLAARAAVRGPFAVANADDYYGREAFEVLARALEAPQPAPGLPRRWYLVGYPLESTLSGHGTVSRGVCEVAPDGTLLGIREHLKVTPLPGGGARDLADGRAFRGDETVSLNLFGLTPEAFPGLESLFKDFLAGPDAARSEFFAPAALDALLRRGDAGMRVLRTRGPWFGVTYREDRERVAEGLARLVAAGEYPCPL